MPSPTKSPVKVVPIPQGGAKAMNFGGALNQIIKGKKVRRLEWENKTSYITFKDDLLHVLNSDGLLHPLMVHKLDIVAKDWVVC